MKNKITAIVTIMIILTGCGRRSSMDFDNYIMVSAPADSISIDSIVEEYRVIPIHSDSLLIGELISVAQHDSLIYALDSYGTLALTSLRSEKTLMIRNLLGEGPGECIRPQAVAVDSDYVYIYDMGRMSLLCYSADSVAYQKKISVGVPSMSIAAGLSKVAVANLELQEDMPHLVKVNVAGGDVKELCPVKERCDMSYVMSPPMVYTYESTFCFVSAWNNIFNEIDISTDSVRSTKIRFAGFADGSAPRRASVDNITIADERPVVMNVFQNGGYKVVQYVYKERIGYCFIKGDTEILNGNLRGSDRFIFSPQLQSADYLIGTSAELDLDGSNAGDSPTYVILTRLK